MTQPYEKSPEAAMERALKDGRLREEGDAPADLLKECREIAAMTTMMVRDSDAWLEGQWDHLLPNLMWQIARGYISTIDHDCSNARRWGSEERYETSGESIKHPRVSTDRLPDNYHERDCEYVVSDDPAPCTCGYYDREQAAIAALSEPPSRCGESRPTNSAGRPEARKSAATPAEPDEPSEARRLRKRYDELLYAVSRKFEGEDRHETALRYIREAEADFDDRPAQSQRKAEQP